MTHRSTKQKLKEFFVVWVLSTIGMGLTMGLFFTPLVLFGDMTGVHLWWIMKVGSYVGFVFGAVFGSVLVFAFACSRDCTTDPAPTPTNPAQQVSTSCNSAGRYLFVWV